VETVAINSTAAPAPRILHLDNGTPVIVQESGLSATLHLTAILRGRYTSDDSALGNDTPIHGRSAFSLTATNREQHALIQRAAMALRNARPESAATAHANDPYLRMEQIFARVTGTPQRRLADALAVPELLVVAGRFDTTALLDQLNDEFATNNKNAQGMIGNPVTKATTASAVDTIETGSPRTTQSNPQDQRAESGNASTPPAERQEPSGFLTESPAAIREHIDLPLAQARTGYIVTAPGPQDPSVDAWRAALYILSHDYEGRLGKQAISRRGLVYYIDSGYHSDGTRGWMTFSAGVDPQKQADFRALLEAELERLLSDPPSAAEVAEALQHRTGRALSEQQSNQELADSLARQWLWQGQLESPAELSAKLARVSRDDILLVLQDFVSGTIVEVTVRPTAEPAL